MADTNQRIGLEFDVQKTGEVDAAADLKAQIEGIKTTLTATEQSSDNVTRAMVNNFRQVGVPLTQTQILLRDLRSRIEEVRATGGVVPPEFIAQLERLEQAQAQAIDATGKWRAAQQQATNAIDDATEAAGGQVGSITSLNDIVNKLAQDLGPAALKFATWSAAVLGAFTVGYEAGQKLRAGLNWLTDGEFDRNVQASFSSVAEAITSFGRTTDQASERAQLLANQLHILKQNGIDPTGLSAEQVQQKVDALGKGMLKVSEDAAAGAKKVAEWAKGLPNKDELDGEARALAQVITQFQAANNVSAPKLRELFGQEIQGVIDRLRQAGVTEIPAALQTWANALGVLPSSVAAARDKVQGELDKLRDALGLKTLDVHAIQAKVAEVNVILAELGHPPEGQAKAVLQKFIIDNILTPLRDAKQQIPPEVAEIADKLGVMVGGLERATASGKTFGVEIGATDLVLKGFTTTVTTTAEAVHRFGDDPSKGGALKDFKKDVDDANTAVHQLGDDVKTTGTKTEEGIKGITGAAAATKTAIEETALSMDSAKTRTDGLHDSLAKVHTKLGETKQHTDAAKTALGELAQVDFATQLLTDVSRFVTAIAGIPDQVRQVVEEVKNILGSSGPAAGGAGGG